MNPDNSAQKSEGLSSLLNAGAEIAGGVAGAAVGLLAAGPPGALAGGASGPLITMALKRLGAEVSQRLLAPREQKRIGATLAFAVNRIKERLDQNDKLRDDGFFDRRLSSPSTAEEVFEGVVLAAQREHEERKLPFMGNLMANLAFHPEIDRGYANYLIKLAEGLSFRQLSLLLLFALRDKSSLRQTDYRSTQSFSLPLVGILHEILELEQKGLIASGEATLGVTDIAPARMNTQGAGSTLVQLMELQKLPLTDLRASSELLKA